MNVINANLCSEKQLNTTYQNPQVNMLFTRNDTSLSYIKTHENPYVQFWININLAIQIILFNVNMYFLYRL